MTGITAVIVWIVVGYIGAVCLLALLVGGLADAGQDHKTIEEVKKLNEETEEFVALPAWWW
jgi:hypothetical protein